MSTLQVVKTKGGVRVVMVGTSIGEVYMLTLPLFEIESKINLGASVHTICSVAPGLALLSIKDRIVAISIGRNFLE
jgi:hypothetical protein